MQAEHVHSTSKHAGKSTYTQLPSMQAEHVHSTSKIFCLICLSTTAATYKHLRAHPSRITGRARTQTGCTDKSLRQTTEVSKRAVGRQVGQLGFPPEYLPIVLKAVTGKELIEAGVHSRWRENKEIKQSGDARSVCNVVRVPSQHPTHLRQQLKGRHREGTGDWELETRN